MPLHRWLCPPSALVLLVVACGDDHQSGDVAADATTTPDGADGADAIAGDVARWDAVATPWPMFGGDPQRSGRSPFVGPTAVDEAKSWRYEVLAGASVNMQPTITAAGVYFGSWGIDRGAATTDPATSHKSDGRYYGLDTAGHELFAPFEPSVVPACYTYAAEAPSPADEAWCGAGAGLHVTFYNGTIEGTGLVDPWNGRHYVGRGDGRLYAIDPGATRAEERVAWSVATLDPTEPALPDGGGEVVGGATMGPDGTIYFATYGVPYPARPEAPVRETHAVYAVSRAGATLWRYPSANATLDNAVVAAVALAPDGKTVYVGTWLADTKVPGRLLALDTTAPADAPDATRLKWSLALENGDRPLRPKLWVRHLTVGPDGVVYVAAGEAKIIGFAPAVMAIVDEGDGASVRWIAEPHGYADAPTTLVQGLALGDGVLVATTGDVRDLNGKEGIVAALDPADGAVLGTFDPGDDAVGSLTGPLLDAAGHVYVGARGRHDLLAEPFVAQSQWRHGTMFGLAWDAGVKRFTELWRRTADGLLDWATPALDAQGTLYYGSTAPLPVDTPASIWKPLEGTPERTTCWFYAVRAP